MAMKGEMTPSEREWNPTHRHYKGGLYRQIGTARHSETPEIMAIYENDRGEWWARPLDMFVGMVEVDGAAVRRFEPIKVRGLE